MTRTKKLFPARNLRKYLLLLLVPPLSLAGQVLDDFSDGNFTENPTWSGDTSQFQVSNSTAFPQAMKPGLQLSGTNADTSLLCLPNLLCENTEWRFWIKLSFNTSANNYARIYLVSDQSNLEGGLNGYFLQLGGVADSLYLCRQQGLETQVLLTGSNAFTGNSTNLFRIRVIRDQGGMWQIFSDPAGGFAFQPEGSVWDNAITATSWFGIYCRYTSSNATKFYFDDFYIGDIEVDTLPPEISGMEVTSSQTATLDFNENLEPTSAQATENYFVSGDIGYPLAAVPDEAIPSRINLQFDGEFEPGTTYLLKVTGVADLSGNVISEDSVYFSYNPFPAIGPGDILIHEVMTDVNPPPPGLPETDYLELYNATDNPLNLSGCSIRPRESANPIILPEIIISPGHLLIITQPADTALFAPFGQVLGLSGFSMNNAGTLVLRNPEGQIIHAMAYTTDWYHDGIKSEGGWSLEMIDPGEPCAGSVNWMASVHPDGGTPGSFNSVHGTVDSSPEISQIEVVSPSEIRIFFSEAMDSLSVVNQQSYYFLETELNPVAIFVSPIVFQDCILQFSEEFVPDSPYTLQVAGALESCSGEYLPGSEIPFVYPSQAAPFEVVINEILSDPTPPVGLPEFEFIEIFNATDRTLDLKGWILQIDATVKPIPGSVILPHEYLILCSNEASWLYELFGKTFTFSTFSLPNSGGTLSLLNGQGTIISSVSYSNAWFDDPDKAAGGWALEQIDPFNACAGAENWSSSLATKGGTPGMMNSCNGSNPISPEVISVLPVNGNSLAVEFNQAMDISSLVNPDNFSVDPNVGHPTSVDPTDSLGKTIRLYFSYTFLTQHIYSLSVEKSVANCAGIGFDNNNDFPFGVSEPVHKNDVVINEVLFNPVGDGDDFVEIYNRSQKIIDLTELKLGEVNADQFGEKDTVYKKVTPRSVLLLPGMYLVLTKDPATVKSQYFTSHPENFLPMASFPAYSNESGSVIVASGSGTVIDAFDYMESMHFPLLTSVEGVSLERIHYNRPSKDLTNWHSASSLAGFATPADPNSQFSETGITQADVYVSPELFSPDNDGWDDVLNIGYRFSESGFTATIRIFDSQGRLTRTLVSNELLGTEGTLSWDGRTDDDRKASIGIYVIFFEGFNPDGHVEKHKLTAVLAGKFTD